MEEGIFWLEQSRVRRTVYKLGTIAQSVAGLFLLTLLRGVKKILLH